MFLRFKRLRECVAALLICALGAGTVRAGITATGMDGITVTAVDGISLVGLSGIRAVGTDGLLAFDVNGITATGMDGITATGMDGVTYTGANVLGARGVDTLTLAGADGITATGMDGITATGMDGVVYHVNSLFIGRADGITATGMDGITATGMDGITATGMDALNIARANGITATGMDGITATGMDGITATGMDGVVFPIATGALRITGVDRIAATRIDGLTLDGIDDVAFTGADGIVATGMDGITATGMDAEPRSGLRSVDPELALLLDRVTDDSSVNAAIVYHRPVTDADINDLRRVGIIGGTRYRALPVVAVTTTRRQLVAVSRLPSVRSIYGNRTLQLTADPYRAQAGTDRVARDRELTDHNNGLAVTGRGVAVAVLDTGLDSTHADLAGRVVENVKVLDTLGVGLGFNPPAALAGLPNTDLVHGHGTFTGGLIAGSGARSDGLYDGVAPGANLVGVSAGELSLLNVVAGFDYLLSRPDLGVRVVNCSFSANTVYDENDPVNVATKMLTERGVSVVFSAGNTGPGLHTLNPYAAAPWVVSVGATDRQGRLADFSARGDFGSRTFRPTLVAPGVDLVSLRSSGVSVVGTSGLIAKDTSRLSLDQLAYYTTASGTSFSAPQVAGVIALMLEANPQLTPAQVKDILQRTATPLAPYYAHEAGAGMLNAHAAVLEAAYPQRRIGAWRAALDRGQVRFRNDPPRQFGGTASALSASTTSLNIPSGALLASVQIAWGPTFSPNDLKLTLSDPACVRTAQSNAPNAPGLTGRRERVVLDKPAAGAWRARVEHSLLLGTAQKFSGTLEVTRAEYAAMPDLDGLSGAQREDVYQSLRSSAMWPTGDGFRPQFAVTRADLAAALVAGARVPQYVPGRPTYADVRDPSTMLFVESVQAAPGGALFHDAEANGNFRPGEAAERLAAAVALVRAAGLRAEAEARAGASVKVSDAAAIPAELRGYVAVALERGLFTAEGGSFRPRAALTRLELARAMAALARNAAQ